MNTYFNSTNEKILYITSIDYIFLLKNEHIYNDLYSIILTFLLTKHYGLSFEKRVKHPTLIESNTYQNQQNSKPLLVTNSQW